MLFKKNIDVEGKKNLTKKVSYSAEYSHISCVGIVCEKFSNFT